MHTKLIYHTKSESKIKIIDSVKFTEGDHEKVDRLMELHEKYSSKVDNADSK